MPTRYRPFWADVIYQISGASILNVLDLLAKLRPLCYQEFMREICHDPPKNVMLFWYLINKLFYTKMKS